MISVHPAGDDAFLIDFAADDPGLMRGVSAKLSQDERVRACIAGHTSLFVLARQDRWSRDWLDRIVASIDDRVAIGSFGRHLVPVNFASHHAPELPLLAAKVGLGRSEVIEQIVLMQFRARYLGFLAGFAYLDGFPTDWALPRLDEARVRVPPGSFAVAGGMAGFYPIASPGGWNLLGRTTLSLWREDRDPPNLIFPGDEIRLVPTNDEPDNAREPAAGEMTPPGDPIAKVSEPGQRTRIVSARDDGRYGFGLPASGPFDEEGFRAVNGAVGNRVDRAVLECVLVGPVLRFSSSMILSWHGAEVAARINGREVTEVRQFKVQAGDELEIGPLRNGLRGMLAFRGGLGSPVSRNALCPPQIAKGDELRAGQSIGQAARIGSVSRTDRLVIRAWAGPHALHTEGLAAIEKSEWTVTPALDRVGVRLSSAGVSFRPPANLMSCGMQFGTVQWHPGGELVLMGPDHPVTGGYLQPLTVLSSDRWKIGQLMPGEKVRFVVGRPPQ